MGISVSGICLLYCIAGVVTPPYVALDTISNHENEVIRTKGLVTDLHILSGGGMLLTVMDNGTELPVYLSLSPGSGGCDLKLRYGDEIELVGRVERYRGSYELVASGEGVKIEHSDPDAGTDAVYFVTQVARYPDTYKGRRIRVVGYTCEVYRRIFYLCSDHGEGEGPGHRYRMKVRVEDEGRERGALPEVEEGERIIADGVLVYNHENMQYELNLISLSLAAL